MMSNMQMPMGGGSTSMNSLAQILAKLMAAQGTGAGGNPGAATAAAGGMGGTPTDPRTNDQVMARMFGLDEPEDEQRFQNFSGALFNMGQGMMGNQGMQFAPQMAPRMPPPQMPPPQAGGGVMRAPEDPRMAGPIRGGQGPVNLMPKPYVAPTPPPPPPPRVMPPVPVSRPRQMQFSEPMNAGGITRRSPLWSTYKG